MCNHCDYRKLLIKAGLEPTDRRMAILHVVGDSERPLTAREVSDRLLEQNPISINRVTVYRILDRLVDTRLLDRLSSGDRSFRYGLAPNAHHQSHPHFYCTSCGRMECLTPVKQSVDLDPWVKAAHGSIQTVHVRLDGTCDDCLKNRRSHSPEHKT